MQRTQQNYKALAALTALLVALCGPAWAAAIVHPAPADPLLSGGRPSPCDPGLDQPDYVGQVDVAGKPVVPADISSARNPVPAEILVPLGEPADRRGQGPVAALDGQALEPLLNPLPNCAAKSQ